MRKTELQFESVSEFVEKHGIPHAVFWNAIGYLSCWSADSKPRCEIQPNRDGDMVAHYYNENGEHAYTIGAVWHEDEKRYSLHS